MQNLRPEEEIIIKDCRNLFRQEKDAEAIEDRMLKDIKNLFEHEA